MWLCEIVDQLSAPPTLLLQDISWSEGLCSSRSSYGRQTAPGVIDIVVLSTTGKGITQFAGRFSGLRPSVVKLSTEAMLTAKVSATKTHIPTWEE